MRFTTKFWIGFVLLFISGKSFAVASSYSRLDMHWDQFSVTGGELGTDYQVDWIYYGAHSGSEKNVDHNVNPPLPEVSDSDSNSTNDPTGSVTTTTTVDEASGYAHVSGTLSRSQANALANGIGATFNSSANGSSHWRQNLSILVDEVDLTFKIPFSYVHDLSRDDAQLDDADAFSRPSIFVKELVDQNYEDIDDAFMDISNSFSGSALTFYHEDTDMLTISGTFFGPTGSKSGVYWLEGHAYNAGSAYSNSVVPLPGAVSLLASGFLGLWGMRQRRS